MDKLIKVVFSLIITISLSLAVISLSDNVSNKASDILSSPELSSPSDWIKEEQIKVYDDKVIFQVMNPTWAKFTNTNSMDPFIDESSHAIEILPEDPDLIEEGDVIAYETSFGIIIHRVIEKGKDDNGIYYVVKGDNNTLSDPSKVRFKDIKGVVVAVIY